MERSVRYQGAIVQEDCLLLIRHQEHVSGRDYWVIPGGGRKEGESEEACVIREMKEETNLDVEVVRLILDEPHFPGRVYQRARTFLCRPVGGEAQPGYEPEPEASQWYGIVETGWFDLCSEADWGEKVRRDPITYPLLLKLQAAFGYL